MRNIAFAFVAGMVFFFVSCQKEITFDVGSSVDSTGTPGPGTPGTGSSFLVRTYTEKISSAAGTDSTTFNLTYDSKNRVVSIISASNAGDKFVYKYNANNTYTMDLYNSNALSISGTFFINSFNLVDSLVQINDTQDTTTEKILYDGNKRPVQMREYDRVAGANVLFKTIFYDYDTNGNLISETSGSKKTTYTHNSLLDNLSMGQVFNYRNKNLVQTTTTNASGSNITANHTYTFDSQNRQTSEKITVSSGESATKTYTY